LVSRARRTETTVTTEAMARYTPTANVFRVSTEPSSSSAMIGARAPAKIEASW
jgi:hypothetical protein